MGRTEHALKHTARQCHPLWANQKTSTAVVKMGECFIHLQCGHGNRQHSNNSVISSDRYIRE